MRERRVNRTSGRRGFSLAEMLTVALLAGVVLFLLAQLLVPSAVLFHMQTAKADVHQGQLVFSYWVNRHLANTLLETVTVTPWPKASVATVGGPAAIAFREVNEDAPYDVTSGVPNLHERFRILYLDELEHRVVVREWPPTPPNLSFDFDLSSHQRALSAEQLSQICAASSETDRVLVRNVESLSITDDDGDLTFFTPPLSLTLTCAEQGRDQRAVIDEKATERVTIAVRVTPRNVRW